MNYRFFFLRHFIDLTAICKKKKKIRRKETVYLFIIISSLNFTIINENNLYIFLIIVSVFCITKNVKSVIFRDFMDLIYDEIDRMKTVKNKKIIIHVQKMHVH